MRRIWKIGLVVVFGLGLAGCAWLFAPPQAVLTANVTSGTAPLDVQFDLSGSTGDIVSYTLTFGDGSDPATGSDITVAVVHTYTTPGTRTATLTVQDARARTSTASVVITVNAAPTATVSLGAFPASGPAPLNVKFWANITAAPGRRIKHIALDYETDGTPDFESAVDFATYDWWIPDDSLPHPYTNPGTYTATLAVTDDASPAQTFTATATITVTSPPPEITAFNATHDSETISFDEDDPTLTIASEDEVTFSFTAVAGATERKIVKWTLDTPGSDPLSKTMVIDPIASLPTTTELRVYTNTTTQTKSYTAMLTVFDDINKSDTATITIEVVPAAP
ncbi:MAG TPA: PKD domain-containing protein [Candidatus Bipolaricaulis sp.]|mgnify:CR=1 FL=1|nr:PKD domain-containing protein [Candidatus Bipolaricaulis sp.]HRS14391.1 PKD domain-containing protein [Candidatus Bipolaricaulis sp.]HRU21209.1 PKD domain-containing protein [Candidatus Bipolaricaulis sp.]